MVTRRRGLEGSDLHSQTARHFPFGVPGANRYDRLTSRPDVAGRRGFDAIRHEENDPLV